MTRESVVIPAVRVPRRLWLYLEELRKRKMYETMAELVREALREYVERHRGEIEEDFKILEAIITLREGEELEELRERRLMELAEKLRSGH